MNPDDVPQAFKKELTDANIKVEKLILFGSRARGDHLLGSDFDFIVVSKDFDGMSFPRRLMRIEDVWSGKEPVNALAYTPREFQRMKDKSYVVAEAIRDGVVIA